MGAPPPPAPSADASVGTNPQGRLGAPASSGIFAALGSDDSNGMRGALQGDVVGEAFGFGGLGAVGTGAPTLHPSSPPTVRGMLAPEVVRRVVRRNHASVQHCYSRSVAAGQPTPFRAVFHFVITGRGTVMSPRAELSGGPASPRYESCLVDAVSHWTFPAPQGGGIVMVDYPFEIGHASESFD
jgi:hypothetical protein